MCVWAYMHMSGADNLFIETHPVLKIEQGSSSALNTFTSMANELSVGPPLLSCVRHTS